MIDRVWEVSHIREGALVPDGVEFSPLSDAHHGRHVVGMAVREVTPSGASTFVATRCDGGRIEVMLYRNDGSAPELIPITRRKAIDLAHQLLTHVMEVRE